MGKLMESDLLTLEEVEAELSDLESNPGYKSQLGIFRETYVPMEDYITALKTAQMALRMILERGLSEWE
jgi:hypothetical protein